MGPRALQNKRTLPGLLLKEVGYDGIIDLLVKVWVRLPIKMMQNVGCQVMKIVSLIKFSFSLRGIWHATSKVWVLCVDCYVRES